MTARLQVVVSDNLAFREQGIHVDAHERHVVALDGEVRELDLTTENALELRRVMRRYLDAGDPPGTEPEPPEDLRPAAHPDPGISGWKIGQDMREWADRNMPGSYARRGENRTGYDYTPALRRAYWGSLRDLGSPWQYHKMFADLREEHS